VFLSRVVFALDGALIFMGEMRIQGNPGQRRGEGAQSADVLEITRPFGGMTYSRRLSHGLLTVTEAADLLSVTTRTVRNRIARGGLWPVRRGPRVFIRLSALTNHPELAHGDIPMPTKRQLEEEARFLRRSLEEIFDRVAETLGIDRPDNKTEEEIAEMARKSCPF
jgi:excisionase family DNA binding protein